MLSRVAFYTVWACLVPACWGIVASAAEIVLPEGSAPPPVVRPYFPDRIHEFVWVNWNLVEPAKLAKLLGASARDVVALAESMGLPPPTENLPEQQGRDYYMLIRRNWHLLPYDQLLDLVDMTPERLAVALREDDALYQKLGELKPKCAALRYTPPDEAARRRAGEIKRVVEAEFGQSLRGPSEPRFLFLRQFLTPVKQSSEPAAAAVGDESSQSLQFIYSYFAGFGDPLANPRLDPYPDELLRRLSALGINGVWLSVLLRDMAPGGAAFPEFGVGHEQRLARLRALVERAKRHGISVYLYLNEPRARPAAFFEANDRAEMAGIDAGGGFRTMCTSHPAVRQWLRDAIAHVFRQVPDLGGIFTITTGEAFTSCASYDKRRSCPRCKNRTDAEIVAEVNATLEQGVHSATPKAKVIAWDWDWQEHGDTKEIIARLPKSMWLMSVSEWSLPLERGGVRTVVDEYSISAVGPGPKAIRHWGLAQEAGLKTAAKVQLNNSWELSTVPYLPVMDLVAQHCHALASRSVDGMMMSWTHGGYPSPNLDIAARFRVKPVPSVDEVLSSIAVDRYGREGAPLARKAWTAFSTAFTEYPFSARVLYFCPIHLGPANPLYLKRTGYRATMTGIPYDDVTMWRGPYPADVFIAQFEKVAAGWRSGIPHLQAALEKVPANRKDDARAELRFARVAAIHFQAVVNQARFTVVRDTLADSSKLSAERRQRLLGIIRNTLESEIALARQECALAQEDSRIGFEAANQYFFVPLDLVEKVVNCRWLLERFQ
jgi:hypothetical protein